MADQTQKPEGKELDNGAPSPTDMDFYSDPVIYEQGDVTGAAKETHGKHGTESGSGPRGNRRPDGDIKEEIEKLFAWQSTIDAAGIEVDVQDGIVTLSGFASSQYEKQVAENITQNVLGIQKINNLLNIDGSEPQDQK